MGVCMGVGTGIGSLDEIGVGLAERCAELASFLNVVRVLRSVWRSVEQQALAQRMHNLVFWQLACL